MKLGRHMYPYTWQLSAKFSKIRICQRKVIAKNDEFTMHYVIARLMRAILSAQITMESNWPQWSALSNDTKYSICSHRKLWVNRIWTKVTTRIPPSFHPNLTRIGYDVIFQTAFRPLNDLFFPWKFAVTCRVALRRAPLGRIFKIGQGGHLRRNFVL